MDSLTLVLDTEHIVVTLTSQNDLDVPPWVEITVPDDEHVSWRSLAITGVLDLDPLTTAGAAAFGLDHPEQYAQTFAHIELADADLGLWAVSKTENSDLLGWVLLDEAYTVVDFYALPVYFSEDDL